MRLLVFAFLAIATAISVNAIYLQTPPQFAARAGRSSKQNIVDAGTANAATRARALMTAALPGYGGASSATTTAKEAPRKPAAAAPAAPGEKASSPAKGAKSEPTALVRLLQRKLARFGYSSLPQDGLLSRETRAAILAAQFEQGLPLTGEPGNEVLTALYFLEASGRTKLATADRFEANPALVKEVQDELAKLGYSSGPVSGKIERTTRDAIRRFATDRGLEPDGRLSERILLEMMIEKGKPFLSRG